jgi:hypothetical protein
MCKAEANARGKLKTFAVKKIVLFSRNQEESGAFRENENV